MGQLVYGSRVEKKRKADGIDVIRAEDVDGILLFCEIQKHDSEQKSYLSDTYEEKIGIVQIMNGSNIMVGMSWLKESKKPKNFVPIWPQRGMKCMLSDWYRSYKIGTPGDMIWNVKYPIVGTKNNRRIAKVEINGEIHEIHISHLRLLK